jgi:hypothetical protein
VERQAESNSSKGAIIHHVQPLLDTLAAELEHPRELSIQVVDHITGTYGVDRDSLGPFLMDELPKLEDYEHDLILSPLFTPKLADQSIFAELLGRDTIPKQQWPALIDQLARRPTRAKLITSDRRIHLVLLREVALERYVHRLRLDATIPETLYGLLNQAPAVDRPMLKAIARRLVWENDARRNILESYLGSVTGTDTYNLEDMVELLRLVESYRPADTSDLLARIPQWQRVLEEEISKSSGPKPFFSATIQNSHGGERDQRPQDDSRLSAKKGEFAFLHRLQQKLGD